MNDEAATSLTPVPRYSIARMDRVLKIFAGLKQDVARLLDIGCGGGTIALQIKHACNAVEVYGVDQDNDFLSLAKEKGIKTFIWTSTTIRIHSQTTTLMRFLQGKC